MADSVTIVGAGLAGSEAALQLASRGVNVRLLEQKPELRTPAQSSDALCELVCSNSFRGAALSNAVGLLKEEMRRLGSFVIRAADATRVPAGGALAVDREKFSERMTGWLHEHPRIEVVSGEVTSVPDDRPLVIATGPLTGDALAADIARRCGLEGVAYYDAIAPIVSAESIDWDKVFIASRWGKGETEEERSAYVNCPMNKEQYQAFVAAILEADRVQAASFEDALHFEGCLPVEVMASRGERTLAFGPMKPTGLDDPRTGRWPYAVVQLRKENAAGTAYNLVGFQSRMKWADQKRVFGMIPGLENAEFYRYGVVHRNTFVDAPKLLDETMQLVEVPGVYLAGQLTGTEGYVESAAGGWMVADVIAQRLAGCEQPELPPRGTAHGGLRWHLSVEALEARGGKRVADYQPSNITFAHFLPWDGKRLKKRERYEAVAKRSLAELDGWIAARGGRADT